MLGCSGASYIVSTPSYPILTLLSQNMESLQSAKFTKRSSEANQRTPGTSGRVPPPPTRTPLPTASGVRAPSTTPATISSKASTRPRTPATTISLPVRSAGVASSSAPARVVRHTPRSRARTTNPTLAATDNNNNDDYDNDDDDEDKQHDEARQTGAAGKDDDDEDEDDDGAVEEEDDEEEEDDGHNPDDDNYDDEEANRRRRAQNIQAMVQGTLEVSQRPIMPRLLQVKEGEAILRQAFKTPHPTAPSRTGELSRRLAARRTFVPWGGKAGPWRLKVIQTPPSSEDQILPTSVTALDLPVTDPPAEPERHPLVLWSSPPGEEPAGEIKVDPMLTKWLRPHQREGVQFMFECVTGLRDFDGYGCILADDMGLGKTLQGISLLWTVLRQGHPTLGSGSSSGVGIRGTTVGAATGAAKPGANITSSNHGDASFPSSAPHPPLGRRAVIVCPTSLVTNWASECDKWLCGRVKTLPLCETSRDDAIAAMDRFLSPRVPYDVMIVSYETFRLHADRFKTPGSCDLLICDEAHRLKNDATLTNRALGGIACVRRVLLSGTPLQNHLDEFYAMVSFCNPGLLGTAGAFRKKFEGPILAGREPGASDAEVALGNERSEELSAFVNHFILRRTNTILSKHLPPKLVSIVCCRMPELQEMLYSYILESKMAKAILREAARREDEGGGGKGGKSAMAGGVLGVITMLKKLCNHPKLVYDVLRSKASGNGNGGGGGRGRRGRPAKGKGQGQGRGGGEESTDDLDFTEALDFFPPGLLDDGRVGRGGMSAGWEHLSGKFGVLARMLAVLWTQTADRIVIVSNYTQTLDLVSTLCREKGYPYVRLDGTTTMKKRQKMVKEFNDPFANQFVFLLSSKAGGCGLNLVGGNRLILFDPDWNPANDKQAAARVWRDGQKKRVYEYRFLSTGTIEEKVFQRQLSKEGLTQAIGQGAVEGQTGAGESMFSKDVLQQLFTYDRESLSDTYQQIVLAGARGARDRKKHREDMNDVKARSGSRSRSERQASGSASASASASASDADSDASSIQIETNGASAPRSKGQNAPEAESEPEFESESDSEVASEVEVEEDEQVNKAAAAVVPTGPIHKPQMGKPTQEELAAWGHHSDPATVDDAVFRNVAAPDVSFVFTCHVDGQAADLAPHGYDSKRGELPKGMRGPSAVGVGAGAGASRIGAGRGGFKAPIMEGGQPTMATDPGPRVGGVRGVAGVSRGGFKSPVVRAGAAGGGVGVGTTTITTTTTAPTLTPTPTPTPTPGSRSWVAGRGLPTPATATVGGRGRGAAAGRRPTGKATPSLPRTTKRKRQEESDDEEVVETTETSAEESADETDEAEVTDDASGEDGGISQ